MAFIVLLTSDRKANCREPPPVLTDSDTLGKFTPPSFASWLAVLRTLFPVPDECLLADAIFSFANAFERGKTPQQAYEAFDIFVSAEA